MLDLGSGPRVECAFATSSAPALNRTVRVQGRVEPACRIAHLPQGEVENVASYAGIKRIVRDLEGFCVNAGKLCLVIQHLFKMRDAPMRVGRIPMEASAKLI